MLPTNILTTVINEACARRVVIQNNPRKLFVYTFKKLRTEWYASVSFRSIVIVRS